jgi:VWFA-related protein
MTHGQMVSFSLPSRAAVLSAICVILPVLFVRGVAVCQVPFNSTVANNASQAESAAPGGGATLRVRVNLVLVPVVVRDAAGNAVGNLHVENFHVFDNGKPQEIVQFAIEKAEEHVAPSVAVSGPKSSSGAPLPPPVFVAPKRFTALFFDDLHLDFGDLSNVRNATLHYLSSVVLSTERVGIFTSSGLAALDFTGDRARLQDALSRIRPEHLPGAGMKDCPELSHYQADEIINKDDQNAFGVAASDAIMFCGAKNQDDGAMMAAESAKRALNSGDRQARYSLDSLRALVTRMAEMPGERSIILASPGFLVTGGGNADQATLVDRAIRSRVVISALDARGLYGANPLGDASQRIGGPASAVDRMTFNAASVLAVQSVLGEIADETGGTFFHNNNDLESGFRRIGGVPEYTYVLGFSPSSLKLDGKLHALKVTLNTGEKLAVTARHEYFAPRQSASAGDAAKQEIEQALFSSGQTRELPVELRIQTVKGKDPVARLTVRANVDLALLPFRVIDGQNRNELTFVTAIFDRDGKYLDGKTRVVGVHWNQEGLESDSRAGKALEISFILKPGEYVIRVVARDAEAQRLFAETTPVEIP